MCAIDATLFFNLLLWRLGALRGGGGGGDGSDVVVAVTIETTVADFCGVSCNINTRQ